MDLLFSLAARIAHLFGRPDAIPPEGPRAAVTPVPGPGSAGRDLTSPSVSSLSAPPPEAAAVDGLACPEHGIPLEPAPAPFEHVGVCPRCSGCFVPRPLDRAVLDAPQTLAGLEVPPAPRPPQSPRYRACPRCGGQMARANLGRVSGILVDRCPEHGTWYDPGELAAALEFVRGDGLARKAAFEARESAWQLEQKKTIQQWDREARSHPDDIDFDI